MKKKIKKIISGLVPKSTIKEKIKLYYYRLFNSNKNTSFDLINRAGKVLYKTSFGNIDMITNEALYAVVPDFNFYQNFYTVKKDDIVIDAGANNGHLSILFSNLVGGNGKVYAFEPDKYNIESINLNTALNPNLANNIEILDLLLWNKKELIDFYEAGTVGSSVVWKPDNDKVVKKQAISIDEWVNDNEINKLDFVKMDIEGAEIEALEGALKTIAKFKPNFAIASYHLVNGEQTYIWLERFFESINYPYKTVKFNAYEIITFAGPNLK